MGEPKRQAWSAYRRVDLACSVGLVFAVLLVFGWCIGHDFVAWDDPTYITRNPYLQTVSWANVKAIWTPGAITAERLYIPLTYMTWLGGQSSALLHAGNVLLHALAVVLGYLLLRRLSAGPRAAFAAALLFAWHPLQVESVAWVMGRKEVLSGALALASLLAYTYWQERRCGKALTASAVLFALALLAKPTVVLLPVVLVVFDLYATGRPGGRDWLVKLPFAVVAVGLLWLNLRLDRGPGLVWPARLVFAAYGPAVANGWLARLFLLQAPNPQYLVTGLTPGAIRAVAALPCLLLLGITYVAWRCRARELWLGLLWFGLLLAPAASILVFRSRAFYTADRYGYPALLGLAFALTGSLLADGGQIRSKAAAKARLLIHGFFVVVLLAAGLSAWRLVRVWRNSETLFRYALAQDADNHLALTFLGTWHYERDEPEQAALWYRRAIAARIDHATAWQNLRLVLQLDPERDPLWLARAERMTPFATFGAPAQSAFLRGRRLEGTRPAAALAAYQRAVRTAPRHTSAWFRLGLLQHRRNDLPAALRAYRKTVAGDPGHESAWHNLGRLHLAAGRPAAAVAALARAVALDPEDAANQIQYGQALLLDNQPAAAVAVLRRALGLRPGDGGLYLLLARACLANGDPAAARRHAASAVELGQEVPPDLAAKLAPRE